jgi:hypothetical protein
MRALKVAVAVMGVLIVGGTVTLFVLIIQRLTGTAATSGPPVAASLEEPAGSHIVGVADAGGGRVAVALQGGGPDRLVVVDLRTGRTLARIGVTR